MKPLVSILIPAYNSGPWLAETLNSALAQTWPNKEIIVVVDEGSTDNTLAVAKPFASEIVKVSTCPHVRAAAARNIAYDLCQGDFIQWLDADDLLAPDKISLQMAVAEKTASRRTLFSAEWAHFLYRTSKARFKPTPLWCDLTPAEWLMRKLGRGDHMQPGTWLVRREIVEAAGRWDEKILVDEDGEYFCRLVLASDGIKFVNGSKVFYRMPRPSSYSNRVQFRADERWSTLQTEFAHLRSLGDTPEIRAACAGFLQVWLLYFYPQRPDIVEQAQKLAATVGGQLEMPRLRWKFAWIEKFFGYETAKRAQFFLPDIKGRVVSAWDKAMFNLERRKAA